MNKKKIMQRLLDETFSHAQELMKQQGHLLLTLRAFSNKRTEYLLVPMVEDPSDRGRLLQVAMAAYDIVLYAAMTEAWILASEGNKLPEIRPSQSERREEALWTLVSDGKTTLFRSGIIRRNDKGGYAGIEEMKTETDYATMGGILAELLPLPPLSNGERQALRSRLKDFPDKLQIVKVPYGHDC